jgi:hypothetical protein
MDPNSLQHLPGMAYVQKFQTEVPFSQYDHLTPDEPGRVWQFAKRLLKVAGTIRTSHGFQRSSNIFPPSLHPSSGEGQPL